MIRIVSFSQMASIHELRCSGHSWEQIAKLVDRQPANSLRQAYHVAMRRGKAAFLNKG